jgi:hypothetical protein
VDTTAFKGKGKVSADQLSSMSEGRRHRHVHPLEACTHVQWRTSDLLSVLQNFQPLCYMASCTTQPCSRCTFIAASQGI